MPDMALANPKIGNLHRAVGRTQEIRRLDVAMNEADVVRGGDTFANVDHRSGCLEDGHRFLAIDAAAKTAAGNELHR